MPTGAGAGKVYDLADDKAGARAKCGGCGTVGRVATLASASVVKTVVRTSGAWLYTRSVPRGA